MNVSVACNLSQINQREFTKVLATIPEVNLSVVTDAKNYETCDWLDQKRIYHWSPLWPDSVAAFRHYHPMSRSYSRGILHDMDPDVLLCLGASRLLFFGLTTGFNPTVFLPMGGETSKAVGNIYWDDRWIKRLRYRFLYSPIFKKNLKHVDEVWGWSEGNRELFSQFGLPSGQFVPFDWGNIDCTRFSPNGDAATFAHEGDTVIGSFRRIRGNKLLRHYEAFMNATGKLREERDDFSVVIGGFYADGSSSAVERLVDEKIQEYNLDDTVEKHNLFKKSEMPSKYRGVDVYVNMNHDDLQLGAIGTSVKEAMACGCATVHFDSPDPTYVIEDGRNGVVVSPTTKSVYNSVSMLINDSKQRTSIADRGRQTAKENFSDEAIRDRVIRRLRRLI